MANVLSYLKNAAKAFPEKSAYIYRADKVSFGELLNNAKAVANRIKTTGVVDSPIGVICERNTITPILFFSVLISGNYYVPIDPDMPAKKQQSIINDANIKILLGTQEFKEKLAQLEYVGFYFTPDDAVDGECEIPDYESTSPCYIVYTSGSTGKPKGVLKSHGAVCSFVETYSKRFDFSSDDIFGNQTPFFFDASAKDIYLALKLSATIEILPTELFTMPPMLIEYMNERKISFISWVPTALSIVAKLKTFSFVKPETVRKVFFVGEVMPIKHLNYWRNALPDVQFVNLYGQSELAGICCFYEVNEEFENDSVLPLGKALDNCEIYLIDNDRIITEPDIIGEMYIVSPALADGYYNDSEKTDKAFLYKDFGNGLKRYFKTGDLAKLNKNGDFTFAARADYQIKHMGHRIELGEIEAVAGSLPEIDRCCCLYNSAKSKIILFACLSEGCSLTGQQIQSLLRPKLSSYMLPSKVNVLETMPLNANGKIDRVALKELL